MAALAGITLLLTGLVVIAAIVALIKPFQIGKIGIFGSRKSALITIPCSLIGGFVVIAILAAVDTKEVVVSKPSASSDRPPLKTEKVAPPETAAADQQAAQDEDMAELKKLDAAYENSLPPFDKLPEPPVVLTCAGNVSEQHECDTNRFQFYKAWISAWGGDLQGQENVAFSLGNPMAGVMPDPVRACAWRLVVIATGDVNVSQIDTRNYNHDCGKLSPQEYSTSLQQSKSIYRRITKKAFPDVEPPTFDQ